MQVDPAFAIPPPDAHLAPIAHAGHDVLAGLIDTVTRALPAIHDDHAVTAARRATDLSEPGADDDLRGHLRDRRANSHEFAGRAGIDVVRPARDPRCTARVVRPLET